MPVPIWQPGTLYQPGALVRPASAPPVVSTPPGNPGFESGDTGWTKGTGFSISIGVGDHVFAGQWSAEYDPVPSAATARIINDTIVAVVPGLSITAKCQVQQGASPAGGAGGRVEIDWLDENDTLISTSTGNMVDSGSGGAWHQSTVTAVAPAGAAGARIAATAFRAVGGDPMWLDAFSWNYVFQPGQTGLIYRAVQADAGFSDNVEPLWPSVLGVQVIDNEVIWEAVNTSQVVWEANPILVSGYDEPTWPTFPGQTVSDGTIIWTAISRRVEDERCPNTPYVAIAASKVFCADDDIIAYSATVNPLDWSTSDDAGYLPFGLQTYGANPVRALGLYRSNLVAFNAEGFQMWQVDQDPQNMALLDAVPISCVNHWSVAPVQNDLAFCSAFGVRNMGIAGASTNLQAGTFGEAIDPLVKEKLDEGIYTPLGISVPAYGQYWLFFGPEAFILTITDVKRMSWSRYVFPLPIEDATVEGDRLYLRTADNTVWLVTDELTADDAVCLPDPPVLSGVMNTEDYPFSDLSWTAAVFEGDIDSYILLRAVDGGLFSELATLEGDVLEYDDFDVESGVVYQYVVIAVPDPDEGEPSLPSNVVALSFSELSPPPVLEGELIDSETDALLTWTMDNPTLEVHEFLLYRNVDGGEFTLLTTTDGDVFTYTDEGLTPEVVYGYYVIAQTYDGIQSEESNTVFLSPGGFSPPAWCNPGAETGDTSCWTVTQGVPGAVARPYTGSFSFWGGQSAQTQMYQDLFIPDDSWQTETDDGNVRIVVDWAGGWFHMANPDRAYIQLDARDAGGTVLATSGAVAMTTPTISAGGLLWGLNSTTLNLPPLTRSVRVTLIAVRFSGTNNDAAHDDVVPTLELINP